MVAPLPMASPVLCTGSLSLTQGYHSCGVLFLSCITHFSHSTVITSSPKETNKPPVLEFVSSIYRSISSLYSKNPQKNDLYLTSSIALHPLRKPMSVRLSSHSTETVSIKDNSDLLHIAESHGPF